MYIEISISLYSYVVLMSIIREAFSTKGAYLKKYVFFRNLSTFIAENLFKDLREHIRINVRMKISVGMYG